MLKPSMIDKNCSYSLYSSTLNFSQVSLPILGKIAAGSPIEAVEQCEMLDLAAAFCRDNCYVLEVHGNSMIGEGILDGDKIICKASNIAREGDIAVVLVDQNEATLKRIQYRSDQMIALVPANPRYKTQVYSAERVRVQGIFIGLLRLPGKN